jgi:hypothetical protein
MYYELPEHVLGTRHLARYRAVNFSQNVNVSKRDVFPYRSINKFSNSCGLQNDRYVVRKVRTKLGSEKREHRTDFMFNLFKV